MVDVPEGRQAPQVGRRRRRLARDVPLAEGRAPGHLGRVQVRAGRHGDAARRRGVRLLAVAVVVGRRPARAPVHLHVLPEGGGVGVGLVAPRHPAVVGLVGGVDVRVLLPVRGVGEAPVAALVLALERFLAWKEEGTVSHLPCSQLFRIGVFIFYELAILISWYYGKSVTYVIYPYYLSLSI